MHGKVLTVRHQAVNRRKDNRFAVALDSEQNNIHVKDIVKVIDGPHSVSKFLPDYSVYLTELKNSKIKILEVEVFCYLYYYY